jgi:hypothetical protein
MGVDSIQTFDLFIFSPSFALHVDRGEKEGKLGGKVIEFCKILKSGSFTAKSRRTKGC